MIMDQCAINEQATEIGLAVWWTPDGGGVVVDDDGGGMWTADSATFSAALLDVQGVPLATRYEALCERMGQFQMTSGQYARRWRIMADWSDAHGGVHGQWLDHLVDPVPVDE
jgi:hypothetical protein